MKMRKSNGPRTEPWGTPLMTRLQSYVAPLTNTLCSLLLSQSLIQCATCPSIPCAFSFRRSLSCGTLSNAQAKSRNMMSTLSLASLQAVTLSRKASRLVTHERPCLNPCWEPFIRSNLFRCWVMASQTIDSITFERWQVRLMGL